MLLASWGPVVLGFGEPIAAAVMLGNVALAARPRNRVGEWLGV